MPAMPASTASSVQPCRSTTAESAEYQHADHLHHGHDPEQPVVGVVGRGEPREIDPGPADRKARKAKADEAREKVAVCQPRGGLGGGEAEAGCKRQIEQEFKWRGDAVRLMRIASTHAPRVVATDADAGLHRTNTERPVRSETRRNPGPRHNVEHHASPAATMAR